jgi:hypothetical protein
MDFQNFNDIQAYTHIRQAPESMPIGGMIPAY